MTPPPFPRTTELRFRFRSRGFKGSPPLWLGVYVHGDQDALNAALPHRTRWLAAGFARRKLPRGHLELRGRRCFIGDVHFHRDALGAGIVAHEMLHAALHAGRAARLKLRVGEDEETLCGVHQRLVSAFWMWWL